MKLFYEKKKFRRHRYKCSKVGPKDGHHDVHSTWAAIFNGLRHKKFKGHSLTQLKIVTRRHDIQHLHIFHLCGSLKYYLRKLNLLAASSFNTQEASWTQIILENFYNPKRFQHIQAMLVGFDCTLEMLHPILNKLPMHVLTRLRIFWSLNWVATTTFGSSETTGRFCGATGGWFPPWLAAAWLGNLLPNIVNHIIHSGSQVLNQLLMNMWL